MWRQERLRGLEWRPWPRPAREPAVRGEPERLLTFARYGARIDKDIGRALAALRSLNRRAHADLADRRQARPNPTRAHRGHGRVPSIQACRCRAPGARAEPERPQSRTVAGRPAERCHARDVPSTVR